MLTDSHTHNFRGISTISIASRIIKTISNAVGKEVESIKLGFSPTIDSLKSPTKVLDSNGMVWKSAASKTKRIRPETTSESTWISQTESALSQLGQSWRLGLA